MKESKFQSDVIKYLRERYDAYVINQIATVVAGVPDIVVCVNGRFIALELKMGTYYKATTLQKRNLHKIFKAGGHGIVFTWSKDWKHELDKFVCLVLEHPEQVCEHYDLTPTLPEGATWHK